ncbi:MAG: ATP-binding protein, partial [Gemmatimonadota bacterium]
MTKLDKARPFVDREPQISELRALADASGPRLALLYGRRRIGKTFLLDYVWGENRRFYFLAADTTADQNRRELLRELATWSGREIDPDDYPSWRTVFRQLAEIAAERPLVVILDEFQYLMGHEEDVVSQLNAVWDREVTGRNLTLVLCGSQVSTMAALEAGDSPLYGRIHWREQLGPFDYFDAASMMPRSWSDRDRAVAYGIWGGTPRYLAAIEPAEPLADAVRRTILSTRGEVHLQLENLIEQEKGIRFPGDYRAVLTAVARGRTGITEIADGAGLGDRRDVARRALETLEELKLVRRERNFGAGRTTAWRYRIADNAVRFWYHFVHANRSRIETGEIESVWEHAIHPGLDTYTGPIFEIMAKEGFRR